MNVRDKFLFLSSFKKYSKSKFVIDLYGFLSHKILLLYNFISPFDQQNMLHKKYFTCKLYSFLFWMILLLLVSESQIPNHL